MNEKIGIIGFGKMGKHHGLDFRTAMQGLIEIAAVVELDDTKYRTLANRQMVYLSQIPLISKIA